MRDPRDRPEDRVVVPDDVLMPGEAPARSASMPGGRPMRGEPRRAGVPIRFWFLGLIVAGALLVLGTSGIRRWWAHRLHDVTGGSWPADFVIGIVIGALPLLGIALGRWRARGARRVMRMFLFGAAGFCVTYLFSSSVSRYVSDRHAGRVFDQQAPGYLWGVLTAELLWLALVVFAWWRLRRWRRTRATRRRGPA